MRKVLHYLCVVSMLDKVIDARTEADVFIQNSKVGLRIQFLRVSSRFRFSLVRPYVLTARDCSLSTLLLV